MPATPPHDRHLPTPAEVERILFASPAMFQRGFEEAGTPTAILDGEVRFVQVNRAFARLFRAAPADLVGRTVIEMTHAEDRPRETEYARTLLDRDMVGGEKRYVRRDGSIIWARFTRVVLARDGRHPTIMMCEVVDQTELHEVMDALRTSQHRLELALEASRDAIYDADLVSGHMQVNARMEQMLGYSGQEFPRRLEDWIKIVEPSDLERAYAQLDAHNRGLIPSIETEIRLRHRDGHWVWVLDRGKVFERDANGGPRRVIGTLTDITERRATAESLARQTQFLDTILSNIPVMVALMSPGPTFEFVNREFERTTGWRVEDMRGRDMMAEFFPDPAVREAAVAFLRSGRTEWHDWRVRARDGRETLSAWTNVTLSDGRIIGLGQDVTHQRQAEADRRRLESQLLQAQKLESLGVLAGGIAHDFNNLLVGILGNASLAGETMPPADPAAPFVESIRIAASRAAELTRQLLAYAGKGQFVVEEVDLSALAEEMTTLLGAIISKKAELRCECRPDLPPTAGDAAQLRQVLMNLVTNASEALGDVPGTITIRTEVVDADEAFLHDFVGDGALRPGRYVVLEVEDTGGGMDDATANRIFEPFFSTKFTGRGLGLAATLGIVRSHRGGVRVRSTLGRGTTVRIVLPASTRSTVAAPARTSGPGARWKATGDVLVADDEPMVRAVAAMGLTRLGFTVTEAVDGQDALERFDADPGRWRLVVLDLTMPRLSGDDALRAIRARRAAMPAVLYSGYTEETLAPDLTGGDGVAFLQKPFTVTTLTSAVRQALGEVD